ncbi:MAG: hypothetical protein ABEJ58_02825 [Halodesulfurarchaeum sp.]
MPTDRDDADGSDPSGEAEVALKREFLVQVLLLNVGLFGLAVGSLVLVQSHRIEMGCGLLLVGVFSTLATIRRYRKLDPGS